MRQLCGFVVLLVLPWVAFAGADEPPQADRTG
jgi:hypothetical protein